MHFVGLDGIVVVVVVVVVVKIVVRIVVRIVVIRVVIVGSVGKQGNSEQNI